MTGIQQFHNTLIDSTYKYGVTTAGNWALGGDFRNLTNPVMFHMDNITFALGYESNVYNNKGWIVVQEGNLVLSFPVNEGTDGSEPLNHPTLLIHIDPITKYVYVIQNAFHVREFRVYKSTYPLMKNNGVFTGGFSLIGTFDTNGSYLSTIDNSSTNNMWFVTREGDSSPADGYDQSIINVDLDNPESYTELLITDTDYSPTQVRHYQAGAYFTGVSDYRTVFINHRYDGSPITYYKVSIYLKKLDDNLIYKFDLSGNKDVFTNGVLTPSELETDYTLIGTDTNKVVSHQIIDSWQINNDCFIIIDILGITYMKKYTIGSLTEVASIQLPYNFSGQEKQSKMYESTDKFILALENNNGKAELWTIEFDLTNLLFRKELSRLPSGTYYGLPENLKDINESYLIIGRSSTTQVGDVPYYITKEKYED